jgi:hypothetical protein
MTRSRTGREIVLDWLVKEIRQAKTADLHRAAAFLEWARGIRKGCTKQRSSARVAQSNAWRKGVDDDVRWRV